MERTNVTDKGYTFNNQNFANETRTDSQGNNYTVAIPTAISSSSLNPVQQVQLPPPVAPVVPNSTNALGYIQSTSDNATRDYEANLEQSRALAEKQTQAEQLLGLRESDTQKAYQEGGVTNLAGELRKLSAQSQALQADTLAKTLAEQNKATGQNITSTAVARNTADATRENVINQAGIAMKSAILKADFDTAKEMADTMINAKYSQLEADIKTKQRQQEIYDKYTLSPSERKMLEAVKKQTNLEEQQLAEKKANEKSIEKLLIEASPVAPPDVLSRAKEIQAKGGSPTEVAMALGQYGGDYLANEKLKLEMKKIKNDMNIASQKASQEQATLQTPEVTGWVTNINNGKAKLSDVPQKLKSAVSLGLSTATNTGNPAKLEDYKNKLTLVDEVLNSGALSAVVGPSPLGRVGYAYNRATGEMQDFTAKVNQLTEGLTLQSLIDAKAKGATFGALSEGELNLLAKSATRLNSYKKLDSNNNIYYDVNESGFKSALKEIKDLTQKAYEREGGSNFVTTGNTIADQFVKRSIPALNNSNSSSLMMQGGYK